MSHFIVWKDLVLGFIHLYGLDRSKAPPGGSFLSDWGAEEEI